MEQGNVTTGELKTAFDELQDKYKEEHSQLLEIRHQLADKTVYTENPYSFNVFLYHAQWGKGQFTIRTRPGEDGSAFLWRIKGMLENAGKMGWEPEPAPSKPPQASAPATVPQAVPAQVPTNGGTTGASAQTFACKLLTCTVADGKQFWKVKGGPFEKWGVAVYPEVLEPAGFTNPDPLTTYNLNGWIAQYSLKEDGKPSKVTKLYKAA